MSELMNVSATGSKVRWRLLATASLLALLAGPSSSNAAGTDDERPTVWVELGGQLSHIDGIGDRFTPDFTQVTPTPGPFSPISPIDLQKPPRYGFGGEGRIVLAPEHTNWVFSAGILYGRSNGAKHYQQQTSVIAHKFFKPLNLFYTYPASVNSFAETQSKQSETHFILNFTAGKDVGLGMFGGSGSSVVSAGMRFAQFTARSDVNIRARPDLKIYNAFEAYPSLAENYYFPQARFHAYTATANATRNFHGIGPSISWTTSAPMAGDRDTAEVTLDWGVNAAVLFGRQKAAVGHQTTTRPFQGAHYINMTSVQNGGHLASRSVTVPNVGGFAGLSVKFPNSKVSFGYRGDIFFGAMDAGIDARHTQNISFHGPFAKISIGFGG